MKKLIVLFIFEILAAANAGVLFSNFDRSWAGAIAGGVFSFTGLAAIKIFRIHAVRFRFMSLLMAQVYTFLFALPFWFTRLMTPFQFPVVSVYTVDVGLFHQISQAMFMGLMFVTFMQIIFTFLEARKLRQ